MPQAEHIEKLLQMQSDLAILLADPKLGPDFQRHELTEQHEALTAALDMMERQGWQPMDSAPKDGSTYLITNALGEVCPVVRDVIQNNIGAQNWTWGERPTGWQPLPPAPAAAKETK